MWVAGGIWTSSEPGGGDRHQPLARTVLCISTKWPNAHLIPLHSFAILLLTPSWQTFLLRPPRNLSCPSSCGPMTSPPLRSQLAERLISRRCLSSPSSPVQTNDPQRDSGKAQALRMRPASPRLRPRRYPCRPRPHRRANQRLMSGR